MKQANILLAAALVAAGAAAYAGDEYDEPTVPQAAVVSNEGVVITEAPTGVSDTITDEQRRVIDAVVKIPPQGEEAGSA